MTLDQEGHDMLLQLQELYRHQVPNGDLARIVKLAFSALREKAMKQKFARTKPRKVSKKSAEAQQQHAETTERSRDIPRQVVREVFARDGGRCTFVSDDGRRCDALGWLELHHHVPFARAGAPTADNTKYMCRFHNGLLAERDFGASFMRRRVSNAVAKRIKRKAARDQLAF
jgi:hypothetical protein